MNADWLALEAPAEDRSWLDTGEDDESFSPALPTSRELAKLTPQFIGPVDLPTDPARRNEMIHSAWLRLNDKQRMFLNALPAHRFSVRATERALRKMTLGVSRSSVNGWIRSNADFKFVLDVLRAVATEAAINPHKLHLMVDEIAELALEGEDVLYQGQPTGFITRNLSGALKAIELQMKATNMLREQGEGARVKVSIVRMTGDWETADAISVSAEGAAA
jgi:hypothetical protein